MGMLMSTLGVGGLPSSQMLGILLGTVHKHFMDQEIKDFQGFHTAILDMFNNINSALPGKHYDVPSRSDIKNCFEEWKDNKDPEEKRKIFVKFMKENLCFSKLDDSIMLTGLVTPPAAMAAKKAGENMPQLKLIRTIPDVIFVPSFTVMALISAKLTRRMFLGNLAAATAAPKNSSHEGQHDHKSITTSRSPSTKKTTDEPPVTDTDSSKTATNSSGADPDQGGLQPPSVGPSSIV